MDSVFAGEIKPHVLTIRTSAASGVSESVHPSLWSAAIISSESTWFFAHPRLSM